MKNTWHYATVEYRAPLRVAAIGVVLWWLAEIALIGGIVSHVNQINRVTAESSDDDNRPGST